MSAPGEPPAAESPRRQFRFPRALTVLASALLAADLAADALVIATDVDAVYADWGTPEQRPIRRTTPDELAAGDFAEGSMGPKVRAVCTFVEQTGGIAAIGSSTEIEAVLHGDAGTTVAPAAVPTT